MPTGPLIASMLAQPYCTFQFVTGEDWTSKIIDLGGEDVFSHVDFVLDDGTLLGARSDEIGGKPAGVQIRPADYDPKWTRQVKISIPCTPLQKAMATDFAMAQVGKEYDKLDIIAFIVHTEWHEAEHWICSQMAAKIGEKGGLWAQLFLPDNKVRPGPLALVASSQRGRIITVVKGGEVT